MSTKRRTRSSFLLTFILFSAIVSMSILLLDSIYFSDSTQSAALNNAVDKAKEREGVILSLIDEATYKLQATESSKVFNDFLHAGADSYAVEDLFLTILDANPELMQIRYIDMNGAEQIRAERLHQGDEAFITPEDMLQDKSHRYYFEEAKHLPFDQIWLSAIDLNIENEKIQIPFNPTFRVVLPLSHRGQFHGILILNYFMGEFLDNLTHTPLYDMIICNEEGNTLYHYDHAKDDHSKCWGNSLVDGYNIASDFPDDYKRILSENVYETDTFVSMHLDTSINDGLILILQLKETYLQKEKNQVRDEYLMIIGVVIFFSLLTALLFYRAYAITLRQADLISDKESSDIKFQTLLESASDGIHVLDPDGNLILYSKSFAETLGYTVEEMQGTNVKCWDTGIDDDQLINYVKELIVHPKTFDTKHIKKDGSIIDVRINAKSVTLDDHQYLYASQVDISELTALMAKIKHQSYVDELTGLHNRKAYNERINELIEQYKRYGTTFSVLMLDIDHFKTINDTMGHAEGDYVLEQLSRLLTSTVRKSDYIYRIGGEEFIILLPNTKVNDAKTTAEHIRMTVEKHLSTSDQSKYITISIGGAMMTDDDTADSLFKRVDDCLYAAKDAGRNTVSFHS